MSYYWNSITHSTPSYMHSITAGELKSPRGNPIPEFSSFGETRNTLPHSCLPPPLGHILCEGFSHACTCTGGDCCVRKTTPYGHFEGIRRFLGSWSVFPAANIAPELIAVALGPDMQSSSVTKKKEELQGRRCVLFVAVSCMHVIILWTINYYCTVP